VVETSDIDEGVYIGHHTYISEDVSIGKNVTIMHNVTIDGKVSIGDNTFIESGTVIGSTGFGFYKNMNGDQEIVPHYAGVRIGSNVHIGANSVVMRGCLGDTVIEDKVKISELCCIAHNDVIKEGTIVTVGTLIAGSTTVGKNVWIAPGSTVNNALDIGDDSHIGIGSVVLKKVKQGRRVFGNPAFYTDKDEK
jgi:UDP-3-O-[3-hydroxymyristoyl] glucosamine N-acyltransferase